MSGTTIGAISLCAAPKGRLSAEGWARRLSVGSIISTYRAVKVFSMGRLGCEARPTFGNGLSQPTCGCPKCLDLAPEVLGLTPRSAWTWAQKCLDLEPVRFPAATRTLSGCNPYALQLQPVRFTAATRRDPCGNACVSTWEHVCIYAGTRVYPRGQNK